MTRNLVISDSREEITNSSFDKIFPITKYGLYKI